ncbi:hypothetical protein FNF27_01120 [Cafeteria roenbergensis]|uniref:Glycosyltransferase subfamily 4-like N-terminal domain-containing protein n=1 Tax=Cafeteria roenbergensis TaxID=33653 RepID=A0A5A8EIG2_CAFRO|nr:hypothetical protein FNF27_01120 [Cafeteria roenbergensis]
MWSVTKARKGADAKHHVAVLVLGDMGRSPRMQYHCASLSKMGDTDVSFVGFGGEPCSREVEENRRVAKVELAQPFAGCSRRFWLLWAPLKVLFQALQLLLVLTLGLRRVEAVLVQNPPSIPVLAVARLATWAVGARLVIDWHNFGYTILSHTLGTASPIVRVSRVYERLFGRLGDAHLCVTAAMRDWLRENWQIDATVVHDKAPKFFRPTPPAERHALFGRLHAALAHVPESAGLARAVPVTDSDRQTLLTVAGEGGAPPCARKDRPAVLFSSTSWTPDEDFGILLDALELVNKAAVASPTRYPPFLVIVTGKGPQKAEYEARIRAEPMSRVAVRTLWLEADDYPRIVGCADLGISLHVSTSGLDLPMKVVDMFGAGVPVCAVGFPCLGELVQHGNTGLVFADSKELASQILRLFDGWPRTAEHDSKPRELKGLSPSDTACLHGASLCSPEEREAATARASEAAKGNLLAMLQAGVMRQRAVDWDANWNAAAKPVFRRGFAC